MHRFQVWAFFLCAVACACALLRMVIVDTKKNAPIKLVLNLFLLFAILSPLAGIRRVSDLINDAKDMDNPLSNFPDGANPADELTAAEIKKRLEQLIRDKLAKMGINPRQIRIDITISEDRFDIQEVQVLLDDADLARREETKDALQSYLGLAVLVGGENEVMT
jgi:hypothetical protein